MLPFAATDDARPVLQCVKFIAGEGKLKLVAADGFRLAEVTLDFDEDIEGQVLIHRDELKGIAGALRKAKRVRLTFQQGGEELDSMSLVIDTELIRYRWQGSNGDFPNYEAVIPTEFKTSAHFDTVEAIRAVNAIKALRKTAKDTHQIDLTIGGGNMVLRNPDEIGEAIIPADTDGETL